MKKLRPDEIQSTLARVPEWRRSGSSIVRTFEFADFVTAIKFVNAVARAAEKANHHPDIDIRWNKVTLVLTTHDAGGLTAKDIALAAGFDGLAWGGAVQADGSAVGSSFSIVFSRPGCSS